MIVLLLSDCFVASCIAYSIEASLMSIGAPRTSMIAFIAPTRGSVTLFNTGRLFFSANLWLTSFRFRRKPPSGNSTIHFRFRGT
uniref:Putative secreted protein n=2 Tax=argyritarsis section TaxID=44545 RepID=A0A2M4DL11_ANODA